MLALLDGEIMTNTDAFVDSLSADPLLVDTRAPLVQDLLTLAINQGKLTELNKTSV